MKALRILVRVLPVLAAWLLLSTLPAGRDAPAYGEAAITSHEPDGRPLVDFVTRKQRHAANLEEYFALDDDAEQYVQSPPQVAAVVTGRPAPIVARAELPSRYREPLRSHPARAAPSTGPPHA